ncbi:amidophosphoribosyltransferase [Roseburia sp. CAG:309]|nr:amidophosphoribosyltransferase [Roseburia sp. CAG:309]
MKDFLMTLVFPHKCAACGKTMSGKRVEMLCETCDRQLHRITEPRCKRCSKPIADITQELCEDCSQREYVVSSGKALYLYDERMQQVIRQFKYEGCFEIGNYFAERMAEAFGDWIQREKMEMIMPVPVHRKRLRFRGFNQAAVLAERLGECLGMPVLSDLLIRTEDTKPQKTLDMHKRIANLQKGFAVTKPVVGKRILLVDDIYTTGATLEACGKVLKKAGSEKICFVSLCIGTVS